MNLWEMIVAVVVIGTIGSVLRARYGIRKDQWGNEFHVGDSAALAENERLRDELKGLKERLAVLERLATDNNNSSAHLDREIEKLRDRT